MKSMRTGNKSGNKSGNSSAAASYGMLPLPNDVWNRIAQVLSTRNFRSSIGRTSKKLSNMYRQHVEASKITGLIRGKVNRKRVVKKGNIWTINGKKRMEIKRARNGKNPVWKYYNNNGSNQRVYFPDLNSVYTTNGWRKHPYSSKKNDLIRKNGENVKKW